MTEVPTTAGRCRCARPCVFAIEDEYRCLKCGREPAVRLSVAASADR